MSCTAERGGPARPGGWRPGLREELRKRRRGGLAYAGYREGVVCEGARDHSLGWAGQALNRAVAEMRGAVARAFGGMQQHCGLGWALSQGTAKVGVRFPLSSATAFKPKKAVLGAGSMGRGPKSPRVARWRWYLRRRKGCRGPHTPSLDRKCQNLMPDLAGKAAAFPFYWGDSVGFGKALPRQLTN